MRSRTNGTGWELKLDLKHFTDFSFKLREFMYENVTILGTWCFGVRTAWIPGIKWCAVLERITLYSNDRASFNSK